MAKGQELVSRNKNAPCDAVTHARTRSEINDNQRESAVKDSGVAVGLSQGPTAKGQGQLSPNETAFCYDPTDTPISRQIKGILDDPRNYYRQYPDDNDKAQLQILLGTPSKWPQPADDNNPPDQIFTLTDGTRIPFTIINRPPRTHYSYSRDYWTDRWPVRLEEKERLQVAVARFHELRAAAKADLEKKKAEQAANTEKQCSAVS